jgi:hypothetical protein
MDLIIAHIVSTSAGHGSPSPVGVSMRPVADGVGQVQGLGESDVRPPLMGGSHRHVIIDGMISLRKYVVQVLDLTQLVALARQVEAAKT